MSYQDKESKSGNYKLWPALTLAVPVVIDGFCCPRPADEAEAAVILKKIDIEQDTLYFE